MGLSRVAWLLLAGAAVAWGIFVGSEPLYQISSCEAVQLDAVCGGSIAARYGVGLVLLLAVPVVLCVLPALRVTRGLSWVVAGVLVIGSLLALPAGDSVLAAFVYYLPIGAIALVIAGFQAWHAPIDRSAGVGQGSRLPDSAS